MLRSLLSKKQQLDSNSRDAHAPTQQEHPSAPPPQQQQTTSAGSKAASGSSTQQRKRPLNWDIATGESIPDFYTHGVFDVLHELGSGGSGVTYLCRDLDTGKLVAIKFVARPLPKAAIPFLMGEVEIQAQLGEGHSNIITMRELLLTRTHLGLVMDYASGGALTTQVSCLWESALQRGGLFMEEQEACYYLRQFISALAYCHKHKVAHRDLKLDNTLLDDRLVGPPWLKICDFGFAKAWTTSDANMKTAIGTPVYMSPQMLAARQCASGYSGLKADMWAAGILLFVMLLGTFPFDHESHEDPNSSEAAGEVWLKQQAPGGWRKHPRAVDVLSRGVLSQPCCDLLDGLLEMDEERRLTADQVVSHPWLQLPLAPEQQAAWEELQQEQQQLNQLLAEKREARLARLRREAMLAMMSLASKPPGKNSLIPNLNDLNTQLSSSNTLPAAAATAAAAAAGQQQQQQQQPASPASDFVTSPTAQRQSPASTPGSAPHSPVAAAAAKVEAATPATAASTAAAAAAAATAAAAAAAAAAEAEGDDVFAVEGSSSVFNKQSPVEADGCSQHLSFKAGEGLRSGSLEAKVEAYRQQMIDIRAARIAAAQQQQHQEQQEPNGASSPRTPSAGAAGHGGSSSSHVEPVASSSSTSGHGGSSHLQASVSCGPSGETSAAHSHHRAAGPGSPASSPLPGSSAAAAAGFSAGSGSSRKKGSSFFKVGWMGLARSPFASSTAQAATATAAAAAGGAGPAGSSEEASWDINSPDEVWRIPLTCTADAAAYKLSPELTVAAGALVRQMQKDGSKMANRGRTNRSSCPMY